MAGNEESKTGWFDWVLGKCKSLRWKQKEQEQEIEEGGTKAEVEAKASTGSDNIHNESKEGTEKQDEAISSPKATSIDELNTQEQTELKDSSSQEEVSDASSKTTSSHIRTASMEEIEAKTAEIAKAAAAAVLLSPTDVGDIDDIPDDDEEQPLQFNPEPASSSNATMPPLVAQQSTYETPVFHSEPTSRQTSEEGSQENAADSGNTYGLCLQASPVSNLHTPTLGTSLDPAETNLAGISGIVGDSSVSSSGMPD